MSKLTKVLCCLVQFDHDSVFIQDRSSGTVTKIDEVHNGLYLHEPKNMVKSLCFVANSRNSNKVLWHMRMDHLPFATLKQLIGNKVSDVESSVKDCVVCHLAKLYRRGFPISTSHAEHVFDLIHMDVWDRTKLLIMMRIKLS